MFKEKIKDDSYFRHDDIVIIAGHKDMYKDLAKVESHLFPKEEYGTDVLDAEKFRYFLTRANADVIVLQQDGEVAGYAIVTYRKNSKISRLYGLALAPQLRGKGFGIILMRIVEKVAIAKGCNAISLETRMDNKVMQNMCTRSAFKQVKVMKKYYHDGADAYKYRKDLKIK